jgi:cob(I)alamin adenosyltransferase
MIFDYGNDLSKSEKKRQVRLYIEWLAHKVLQLEEDITMYNNEYEKLEQILEELNE